MMRAPSRSGTYLVLRRCAKAMKEAGFPAAPGSMKMIKDGVTGFYEYEGTQKTTVYEPEIKKYSPVLPTPQILLLSEIKSDKEKVLDRNTSASLIDIGDGVACMEFQTKMNSIDDDTLNLMNQVPGSMPWKEI